MISKNTSSFGYVQGRFGQELMTCEMTNRFYSTGCMWMGCNPLSYAFPLTIIQLLLFSAGFRIVYFPLKRFRQSTLSCQIIAGFLLGRSCLGLVKSIERNIFPPGGRVALETVANIGFVFHLFVIGIHIDTDVVKKMGKDAVAVGIASFLAPFTFCVAGIFILPTIVPSYDISIYSFLFLVTASSMTSFAGTTGHLSDLQILNSDIGRLATLASMVNDTCSYLLYISISALTTVAKEKKMSVMWSIVWNATMITILVYVIRPVMVKFARSLPETHRLKESHFVAITLPALFCGFIMESIGMPSGLGTLLYGSIIPDGPPLGTSLVNKLDLFSSGLLLPTKFGLGAASVNVFSFRGDAAEVVLALIILLGYVGKFAGVLVSGFIFNLPLLDALSLSLIMCCRGVVEISIYITLKESGMISGQAYALLLFSMLVVTGISRPLILYLYDPWRRYAGKHINSILHSNQSHLRVLVCIHGEDNVAPIIDLLSASNPTRESPISVAIINLMELKGRSAAVLERNVYRGRLTSMLTRSQHIAKAFDYLVRKSQGAVVLQNFTSVAPYATMHNDICTIAIDVQAHLIIIPFHKQKQIDGSYHSNAPAIRIVNQNVMKNAPSTVGVLIDRSHVAGAWQPIGTSNSYLRIYVLFLGGGDDREALAYASRMIGNPKLSLTLVWLRPLTQMNSEEDTDDNLDIQMIRHFRANTIGNASVSYREEVAKDAVGTTRVLRSFEGACDLCMVGRSHPSDSPLTQGMLTDWSEYPELGALGDTLTNADFPFSVLVVKQEVIEEPAEMWKHNSFSYSV